MAQANPTDESGAANGSPLQKPVAPPTQSVAKGPWTFHVENPVEQCASALLELAQYMETNSDIFVTDGPKLLDPAERDERKRKIISLSYELKRLGDTVSQGNIRYRDVDRLLQDLRQLGSFGTNALVSNVARAFVKAGLT